MQALYSFYYDDAKDMALKERDLIKSIENIYNLYIYLLLMLKEIRRHAEKIQEERKKKRLPAKEDLYPNTRFVNNEALMKIEKSNKLNEAQKKRKISWDSDDSSLIKGFFTKISSSADYESYMGANTESYESEKEFVVKLYRKFLSENESLKHHLIEKNIHWAGDYVLANISVVKTIESSAKKDELEMMPLYKAEDDKDFMLDLYRKTIMSDTENITLISNRMSNWEPDRLASIDFLLMKMAITEAMNFPDIPVKVTLNEYIEISKLYSSPKSNSFINGILDAILNDLTKNKKIVKTGRGLVG